MTRLEELGGKIDAREARIGVIGLGYVGLPLALEFAKAGFRVTGFDLDAEKIRVLAEGGSYIDDVPAADLAEAVAAGRFDATSEFRALATMDVINVCVPTPLTKTKDPLSLYTRGGGQGVRGGYVSVLKRKPSFSQYPNILLCSEIQRFHLLL